MLVNKAAWIGPDVEWHQEVFNFNIYASGLNKKKNWKNFIQVFIAFDDHEKQNGCLKVLKGSHKSGFLDYEDIVNINGSHKRRVKTKILDKLVKKYPIKDFFSIYLNCFSKPMVNFEHGDSVWPECIPGVELDP